MGNEGKGKEEEGGQGEENLLGCRRSRATELLISPPPFPTPLHLPPSSLPPVGGMEKRETKGETDK